MDDERLGAAGLEALAEELSDWLDQRPAEDFDPAVVDVYLKVLAQKDPVTSGFDPVTAEEAFRARHRDLFSTEASRPKSGKRPPAGGAGASSGWPPPSRSPCSAPCRPRAWE